MLNIIKLRQANKLRSLLFTTALVMCFGAVPVALEAAEPVKVDASRMYTYVAMTPIILPVIDRTGVTQTVSIVISLQVESEAKAELVRNRLPLLIDAYLSGMYGTLSRQVAMEDGVLRVSLVKERLRQITHSVLPPGTVDDVLLQVLQQYPS